ncbi:MAG: ABC transporter permease [Spirochaetia bacterium]|jgi:ABC-2 type transport system permease protein|nr:ABC transporter permease [Spirochaetia bacterium]
MSHREAAVIMKRELRAYFTSPVAYIVIALFLVFNGFFFFKDFFYFRQAEMRSFFQRLPLFFAVFVPALTMRLFSEEKHSGSIEILLTMPVTTYDAVIGKFLAGSVFAALSLAPTLLYMITVIFVGSPDPGPLLGGYIGALFLGASYAAIGVCVSSSTKNQVTAFIIALAVNLTLWLMSNVTVFLPSKLRFLEYFGIDFHFQNIAKGLIDFRDLVYFLSIIVIAVIAAVKIIDERKK